MPTKCGAFLDSDDFLNAGLVLVVSSGWVHLASLFSIAPNSFAPHRGVMSLYEELRSFDVI